jgi:molybdopterin-guanine dinucleotide biosynthesis protein B
MTAARVFGVVGWKNSGKTTLVERLVAEFVRRGWRVATVKHVHHDIDLERPGTDTFRHRAAGAREVALVGDQRYAILHEGGEPKLADVLAQLAPCDLVLIEGFKREPHAKIEIRADHGRPLAPQDPHIVAVAADQPQAGDQLPWFRRDDVAGIANFIASRKG